MNLTLSTEARVIEGARAWAANHGTTINSLVKDYLASLADAADTEDVACQFARNARDNGGDSTGQGSFFRADLYRGKRFGDAEE